MSEPNTSSEGTQTQKPSDTRLTDEDIKRLEASIKKTFPHLSTQPEPTTEEPTKPPVVQVPPTQKDPYKEKYETLEKIYREGVLEELPDDLKDKYKTASFEELKIINDLIPRLAKTRKKGSAIQRDTPSDEEDSKGEGHIGGFDNKKKKWV